ncbi:MAG: 6-phosphofructokinase [Proteobacteria bacterium]|nr:6-phosphofructokinase [Pseudomonadota bacterium]
MTKAKKRIGILTGGGDVPPLNVLISSVSEACAISDIDLIGFLKGWEGVVENRYVDLKTVRIRPKIGGTILKSSRARLKKIPGDIEKARENLCTLGIEGLIVIGGEDTLSNAFDLPDVPQILITKTIDNDVGKITNEDQKIAADSILNYFTLGYPTAAEKISSFVSLSEGLRTTAYSHERIIVVESMGMHAGWLALASSMGHPDFIIIPEFPLKYDIFLEEVAHRFEQERNVIIVVAEGARFEDGSYMSADDSEMDDFGHPRFKGSAEVLVTRLKKDLKRYFDTRNVNAVNPSYFYRSGNPNMLDLTWAHRLGGAAVKSFSKGFEGQVLLTVQRGNEGFRVGDFPLDRINDFEQLHRFVDERFYDPLTLTVTNQGKKYLSTIVDELPRVEYGVGKVKGTRLKDKGERS